MKREFLHLFLKHTIYAGACLSVILLLIESLVPGSVLPYFNILWLVVGVFILTLTVE